MKEPISTVSNLIYLVIALIMLPVTGQNWMVIVGAVGLWIGSTGFHWKLTKNWQYADVWAIFWILAALIELWVPFGAKLLVPVVTGILAYLNYIKFVHSWVLIGLESLALLILIANYSTVQFTLVIFSIYILSFALHRIGYIIGGRWHDFLHGAWHLGTAYGFCLLATGI